MIITKDDFIYDFVEKLGASLFILFIILVIVVIKFIIKKEKENKKAIGLFISIIAVIIRSFKYIIKEVNKKVEENEKNKDKK